MLDKLLSFFSLKHDLYQKLKSQPEHKVSLDNLNNVNIDGIFPFHKLIIDKSDIDSRHFIPSNFTKFCMTSDEVSHIADLFNPIFQIHTYPSYTIDISEIQAFSATKSWENLNKYGYVDEFIANSSPELIQSITDESLAEMLSHDQITIINSPEITSDTFSIFGWSPRIAICNAGGSHHLAAAQYIAKRINQFVSLEAETTVHTLNPTALTAFNKKYSAFVLPSNELASMTQAFGLSLLKFTRMDFNPVEHVKYDIYFFEKSAENSRIISMFNERYTSLNEVLESRILYQNKNNTLQDFIEFSNCMNTQKIAI